MEYVKTKHAAIIKSCAFLIYYKGDSIMSKKVVVALGGNAILKPKQAGTIEEQMENVLNAAQNNVKLVKEGYEVVVAHGNGPQV